MPDENDLLKLGALPINPVDDAAPILPATDSPSALTELDESLLSLVGREIPKTASLIGNGLLKTGRLAILYGVGGSSKSWLTFRLAIAVARGTQWCGQSTTQGLVGLVSFEMFDEDIQERVLEIDADDKGGLDQVRLLTRDRLPILKLPEAGDQIREWVKARKLDLVIIDPLADTLPGPETNEFVGPIIDRLKEISLETGAAVLLIHHTRKSDSSGRKDDPLSALRGPSQLRDRVDLLMYIEKKRDHLRMLSFTKVRGAVEPEPVWLDATGEVTETPVSTTSAEENMKAVRNHLEQNAPSAFTADELVEALALRTAANSLVKSETYRRRYLAPLVEQGLASEAPRRGQKEKKRWRWTADPAALSGQSNKPVPAQQEVFEKQ